MIKDRSFDDVAKEMKTYLDDKIPDISESTRLEIAEFIAYKTFIYCVDAINRRDEEWRDNLNLKRNEWDRKKLISEIMNRKGLSSFKEEM